MRRRRPRLSALTGGRIGEPGLGLKVYVAEGQAVRATQRFDITHGGAPDVAHGAP